MQSDWVVLKFGGTSVAGRPQWDTIASLVNERRAAGSHVVLVCSAAAGVTDRLTALADDPEAGTVAEELIQRHRELGLALEVPDADWLPPAEALLQECLERLRRDPAPWARAELLALGEWLSTQLGTCFLQRQRLDAAWVDARDALQTSDEGDLSPSRTWLSADCRAGPDPDLAARWSEIAPVLVTQGFVARGVDGRTALLGRGGSDTSAALLAGRLGAECVEIWTDVPGLFTADPRLIASARLLGEVDYAEALEMAASGARVVHPRCIRAAAETGTTLRVRDLNRPTVAGTTIGSAGPESRGAKTVTCQEDMAVLLLQNLDARRQVGFLAGVFEVFRQRGISIDLVATSETTTTVAIHRATNHLDGAGLDGLVQDLAALCSVRLYDDCVCVNLVGRGIRTALSRLHTVMRRFDDAPLLMLSQSANDLCLSLLVPANDHLALLREAHTALIPDRAGGIFGPSWEQICRRREVPTG